MTEFLGGAGPVFSCLGATPVREFPMTDISRAKLGSLAGPRILLYQFNAWKIIPTFSHVKKFS